MNGTLGNYSSLVGSVLLLSLVFYPFELLLPAEKNQPFAKRLVNLAYVPIFLLAVVFVLNPIANAFVSILFSLTGTGVLPRWIGPPQSLLQHVVFALAFALWWDLCQYWLHRFQQPRMVSRTMHRGAASRFVMLPLRPMAQPGCLSSCAIFVTVTDMTSRP